MQLLTSQKLPIEPTRTQKDKRANNQASKEANKCQLQAFVPPKQTVEWQTIELLVFVFFLVIDCTLE